jgi:uncharacterized protein (DUF3820 family)
MKMPFGKYKDVELNEVPRPYLLWLRRQEWLGAWLGQAIDDILTGEEQHQEETFEEALKKWRADSKEK